MIRRHGEPPLRGRRYRRRPGAYGVVLHPRGILLTLQTGEPVELQLPGGGIDPGEGAGQALAREALEETGWQVRPIRRIGAYRRFTYMPDYGYHAEKIAHVFLARAVRRRGPPLEPAHEAVLLSPAEALALLPVEGDREMLARAVGARR